SLLLPDGGERDRFALVIVVNQIHPVRPDVTKRVTLLDPLEGAGGNLQWLLQIRQPVERFTNALFDVVPNAQMVGIITLVHAHRDELEVYWRAIPRPIVQADTSELRADAGALQVGIRARMHVPTEHTGANEGDFDCGFHITQDGRSACRSW